MKKGLSPTTGRVMLLCCAMLWGGSYPIAKVAMGVVTPQWLMGLRLVGASTIMLILFRKRIVPYLNKSIIIPGLVTGLTYWGTMISQTVGLTMIEPGRSAFLTSAYCVLVPFVSWLLMRQRPAARNIVAAALCLTGVGFVSLGSGLGGLTIGTGDLLTLCFIVGASFSEPAPNASWLAPGVLACLVYLFLGATMLAQIMQNVGLKVTPPSQASIIMCLETVFSMVFSVLFYGETVSGAAATGFALIFLAILVSQIRLNGRLLERVGRKAR